MSAGSVARDFIGAHVPELSRHTSLHLNLSSPTSMGLCVLNLVYGVLNGVELELARELVYNFFISCSIAEIAESNIGIL